MNYSQRILVIRLSAFGDAAILEPVLRSRAAANPDVLFMLAAPPMLKPLFQGIPNLQYLPTEKRQSSSALYRQLAALKPTLVADMHHVNRVIGADILFRLHGVPVRHIHKHNHPGKPSWKRYDEVFDHCGLAKGDDLDALSRNYWQYSSRHKDNYRIGIAPFAQHKGKTWPLHLMEQLVKTLSQEGCYNITLFGGCNEASVLEQWADRYPRVESVAGRLPFADELHLIASLDVMVSMDSANMHFASCLGVPVVSVWGATHPCRGFYGWRQNPAWAVQADMDCRPCSKYGNKPCRKGGYPCLNAITAQAVKARIDNILGAGN